MELQLRVLDDRLAVCRLAANASIPAWVFSSGFCSVTRTSDELSVVCAQDRVPSDVRSEPGWRALMLVGPFEFTLTGVLTAIVEPLAEAGVPIFAVSTFDTDYVLVKETSLESAAAALRAAGHRFVGPK